MGKQSENKKDVYIPLKFWFNKMYELCIPLRYWFNQSHELEIPFFAHDISTKKFEMFFKKIKYNEKS